MMALWYARQFGLSTTTMLDHGWMRTGQAPAGLRAFAVANGANKAEALGLDLITPARIVEKDYEVNLCRCAALTSVRSNHEGSCFGDNRS